jgi:ABC-type antimicrobial peptide transport system permease subunit
MFKNYWRTAIRALRNNVATSLLNVLNPWVFVLAGGCALAIALFTIAAQTLRAARANPVKNLRTD